MYLFESEIGRPRTDELSAGRALEPLDGNVDNTEYSKLRPGVMLGSVRTSTDSSEYLTSSRVLVEDTVGNRYMTVAAPGFPYGDAVFHPSAALGRQVGTVVMEITNTDVAIVKLQDERTFENSTFESTADGSSPALMKEFVPSAPFEDWTLCVVSFRRTAIDWVNIRSRESMLRVRGTLYISVNGPTQYRK